MNLKQYDAAINMLCNMAGTDKTEVTTARVMLLWLMSNEPESFKRALTWAEDALEKDRLNQERLENEERIRQLDISPMDADLVAVCLAEGMRRVYTNNSTWNTVPAIKIWRERTGAGLKEAKDAIEMIFRKPGACLTVGPVPAYVTSHQYARLVQLRSLADHLVQGKEHHFSWTRQM